MACAAPSRADSDASGPLMAASSSAEAQAQASAERKRGWVGRAIGDIETRVTEDGQLLVRGPSVFSGYWEREEATAAAFDHGWGTQQLVVRFKTLQPL